MKIKVSSGDEMNIHLPSSVEAQAELKMISSAKNFIISPQCSKANFCIVQDSLLAAYKMTVENKTVKKELFYNVALYSERTSDYILKKMQHIRQILKKYNKPVKCLNGRGLISLILPNDFYYQKNNKADEKEPILKIYKGVIVEGGFDKSVLGPTSNSIIQILNKEYGPDIAMNFIDEVQFITNNWLLHNSFSIGIEDCIAKNKEQNEKINDVIQKCYIEAEGIKETTTHPHIREIKITASLSKAKDMGFKIAKDALDPNNNFLSTIKSGSKGDYFNLAQITALCTQQNISGKRVVPILNNGKRTLHHYPLEIKNVELDYESRGFIASSFIKGLNPRQFFFHTISGREGCSDKHNVSLTGSCCLWLSKTISDKQCNLLLIYNYLVTLL